MVGFATYQLDRTNLSSAITGGLADDLSINQNTINLGNQLMFLGVILLEIPSNVILFKIGPRWWIAGQVFVFGTIAAMQVFIRNKAGFLSTRTLLGLAEAGYIPGAMFILSTWYTKAEITKRVAIFFFGMFGGTAISPLLGAGLLKLEGKGGLRGWQWIFLAEGVWSVAISLLLLVLLPPRTSYTTMVEEESKPTSGSLREATDRQLPLAEVWRVLTNIRRWPHFLATACVFATWSPLTTYTPSIIMSLGFSRVDANALAAIGCTLTLPVVYFFAWLSDKTKKRGIIVILAITVYLIALVVLRVVQPYSGRWSKFSLWTAVNGVAVGYHPIHNAWIQINCRTPEERNISLAMFVMSATSGLMGGSQLFRQDESSRYYPRGLLIMIGLVIMGLIFTAAQELIYLLESRDAKRRSTTEGFLSKGILMERSALTT